MANRSWQRLIGIILLLAVPACAGPQPILRPNKQLHLYGKQMAQQEIESCRKLVEKTGLQPGTNQSANAATGAVLGLTLGGAVGASAGVVGEIARHDDRCRCRQRTWIRRWITGGNVQTARAGASLCRCRHELSEE